MLLSRMSLAAGILSVDASLLFLYHLKFSLAAHRVCGHAHGLRGDFLSETHQRCDPEPQHNQRSVSQQPLHCCLTSFEVSRIVLALWKEIFCAFERIRTNYPSTPLTQLPQHAGCRFALKCFSALLLYVMRKSLDARKFQPMVSGVRRSRGRRSRNSIYAFR